MNNINTTLPELPNLGDTETKPVLKKLARAHQARYINQHKADYYRLLQSVRGKPNRANPWEEWLRYMLDGAEQTAKQTTSLTVQIKAQMLTVKQRLRDELPKIYSQDLVNNLFRHPYAKIEFLISELMIHRNTATKYLEELVRIGLLTKPKLGKDNYYINLPLFDLLHGVAARKALERQ